MYRRRVALVLGSLIPTAADPDLALGYEAIDFPRFYREEFLPNASLAMRVGFRLALFVAIWISPLLVRRIPPLSLYGIDTRDRALNAMFDSRFNLVRQMALLLKVTVAFCYGADPRVRDAIGYPLQHDDPRATTGGKGSQP